MKDIIKNEKPEDRIFAIGKNSSNRAFTLIEVLVTLSIFIFIISLALGVGLDTFARTSINDERDTAIFLLAKVRARSLNNINESAHGFKIVGDNFVIYELGGDEELVPFNDNFTISGNGDSEVIFEQLTGKTGETEIFTITGTADSKTITINTEGGISW